MNAQGKSKKKLSFAFPDTYVLLFMMLLIAFIATYLVPAGEYDRDKVNNITVVVPGTYHAIENQSLGLMDIVLAMQKGMVESGSIIFLILFMGGLIAMIEATGALNAGVKRAIDKTRGNEFMLIASITVLFALGGAIGVVANTVIAFVPIGLMLARALKLDPLVAVAITFGATMAGFNVGFVNPYTVGIAHAITELPLFSGLLFRIVIFVVVVAVTIWYTWRYVKRVMRNPANSIVADVPFAEQEQEDEAAGPMSKKHVAILSFVGLAFLFLVYASVQYKWTLDKMSAFFLLMAIIIGFIGKIHYNQFVVYFMKGAEKLLYGALCVGAARAVLIVMEQGKILDTLVQSLSELFSGLTPIATTLVMFAVNTLISILIPSGSGQAVVVMPIITPIADMMGITRQVAVQTYLFGDGFTNSIVPTSGTLMACLGIAGVPYSKWLKWMLPLFGIWMVIGIVSLIIGVLINWGPF